MAKKKCVLAYSGGLDTSVAIKWLAENKDVDVVALTVDLGEQEKDLADIKARALQAGAIEAFAYDVKAEFARDYISPALWANAAYEGKYFLATALARPLIAKKLVEVAAAEGAEYIAHGCTGKGNDQVRFDVSTVALNPDLKVLAPVREWGWSREEEIEYAEKHGIPLPVAKANPFSVDVNLYGRSCEAGVLEDPWVAPPEAAYAWTTSPLQAPDQPAEVEIGFERGVPVSLNGEGLDLVQLIHRLNRIAGAHGVGRIDHVENRLVGIKSREVYEMPAAAVLTLAHRELECLTLPRELHHAKLGLEHQFAELIYNGLWFHPLRDCLQAFFAQSQETVTGAVRVQLYKGMATATGRRSPHTLYSYNLATYDKADRFDHKAAEGFITLFGLPTRVFAAVQKARSGNDQ